MTNRFTAREIANALFDKHTITIPPMAIPYGYGMPYMAYSHTEIHMAPSLEDAAHTLHAQGMSNTDIMHLGHHVTHFVRQKLAGELIDQPAVFYQQITTDSSAYLGLRVKAPLQPLADREDIDTLKSAFITSVSTRMDATPTLFTKTLPPAKRTRFGRRNFGLNIKQA